MDYNANFLWGFPDDSIESLGYEFANAKTQTYQKECWLGILNKVKAEDVAQFLKWAFENYQWTGETWDENTGHDDFDSFTHEELYIEYSRIKAENMHVSPHEEL